MPFREKIIFFWCALTNLNQKNKSVVLLFTFSITSNDFHFVDGCEIVDFPEFDVVQHEGPDVVAKTVRIQFGRFKCDASLDFGVQCSVDGFVELKQHLERQLRCDLAILCGLDKMQFNKISRKVLLIYKAINNLQQVLPPPPLPPTVRQNNLCLQEKQWRQLT